MERTDVEEQAHGGADDHCADARLVADADVEFKRRQGVETLLNCMVHAFRCFGGVTATVLTDNTKTMVLERIDGQPRFHPKRLDFASDYGFVPWVCHPYRTETNRKSSPET